MHRKQFKNRRGICSSSLIKIRVHADKQFKSEFYMTPKQSRKYFDELNSSLYGPLGYRTQLIKFRATMYSSFPFWSNHLLANRIHYVN